MKRRYSIVTVCVPKEIKEEIARRARSQESDASKWIRLAIREKLEADKTAVA